MPGVVLGSDGNLYSTSANGANVFGTAFKETPAGAFSVFYQFQGGTHASFPGPLIVTPNAFYGPASGGAPFNAGVIYRLDQSGETDLYRFVGGADGSSGRALVRDNAGNLYGTGGGGDLACRAPQGCGVVFKLDAKSNYSVLHVFVGPDGVYPGGLALDPEGNLYGTTTAGGTQNSWTVFKLTPGRAADYHLYVYGGRRWRTAEWSNS